MKKASPPIVKWSLLNWWLLRPVWDDPITEQVRRSLIKKGGRISLLLGEAILMASVFFFITTNVAKKLSDTHLLPFLESHLGEIEYIIIMILFMFGSLGWIATLIAWPVTPGISLNRAILKLPLHDFRTIAAIDKVFLEAIKPIVWRLRLGHLLCVMWAVCLSAIFWWNIDLSQFSIYDIIPYLILMHLWIFSYSVSTMHLPYSFALQRKQQGSIERRIESTKSTLTKIWSYALFRATFAGILLALTSLFIESNRSSFNYINLGYVVLGWLLITIEALTILRLPYSQYEVQKKFGREFNELIADATSPLDDLLPGKD